MMRIQNQARDWATKSAFITALMLGTAGAVQAAEVKVSSDIKVSTTWTANNVYNLQKQIYVLPGATLTIQPGTIIASTTKIGGSLAVAAGAQIMIKGTANAPVIMTSTADVATWTNGNPRTGKWREAANEWGNLTLMGRAYVSENKPGGSRSNSAAPSAKNVAPMEGLVASSATDTKVLYGGGNDDDDSGTISYLSIRYGGKVVALNNELNGLSLGGIGRGTDIHHVEVMNNVDDGVEIWGGTVNLKYFSIWNIGDDSFDIDQGWRGKAQFVLIVQGHSLNAKQGSGVGDNCFETDGAEDSDWQPVTTTSIYNATVIGQPFDGDGATAWRDNARVQYHNCIFMDCGEKVVRFDNIDGDGAHGYGFNGTLSWANTWKTPYTATSKVNAPSKPGDFYKSQVSGMLCEITDSVFYNNKNKSAYTEAIARGVFAAANNNVKEPAKSPITSLTRSTAVVKGGKVMVPVTFLDPRPANDALVTKALAPNDGFFSQVNYRGAFAPGSDWLNGWTASSAYGMTPSTSWTDLGQSLLGKSGAPLLSASGAAAGGKATTLTLQNAAPSSAALLTFSSKTLNAPLFGGTLVPDIFTGSFFSLPTDANGKAVLNFAWPTSIPANQSVYFQYWVVDTSRPQLFSASNAILATSK